MTVTAAAQQSWEAVAAIDEASASLAELTAMTRELRRLEGFLDGRRVEVARRSAELSSVAEQLMATAARISDRDAMKVMDRVAVVDRVPELGEALADGTVVAGHVDGFRNGLRALDAELHPQLIDLAPALVALAATSTVEDFGRAVRAEVRRIQADQGVALLERQRKACRVTRWVDPEHGMWRLSGSFDPVTGARLDARLRAALAAVEAAGVPADAPDDPVERKSFLRAQALAALIEGNGPKGGGSELMIVYDTTALDADGQPIVDWGIPVEIPRSVVIEMYERGLLAKVSPVVVHDGAVVWAPGKLNAGRTSRLANRDQRRALRAIYPTCAIPECGVRFGDCEIHHVIVWEPPGEGPSDLDNLLPLCSRHHHRVHDKGWKLTLCADRTLTIVYPDGTTRTTGPPRRSPPPGVARPGHTSRAPDLPTGPPPATPARLPAPPAVTPPAVTPPAVAPPEIAQPPPVE